MHEWSLKRNSE